MQEKSLVLQYEDAVFLRRFASFLEKKAEEALRISWFVREEEFLQFVQTERADLLIVSESLAKSRKWTVPLLYFTEGTVPKGERELPIYRPMDRQIRRIRQALADSRPEAEKSAAACTVLGFFAPAGGIGQSVSALLAGLILAESGPALFISLERYSALQEMLSLQGGTLSDLLYFARIQGDPFERIEMMTDCAGPLTVLAPAADPADLRTALPEDWNYLFSQLRAAGRYRFAVVDLGDGLGLETELMAHCDLVFVPENGSPAAAVKEAIWRRCLSDSGEAALLEKLRPFSLPPLPGDGLLDYRELRMTEWGRIVRAVLKEAGL